MRKLRKSVSVILSVAMLAALGGCSSGTSAPADTAAPTTGATAGGESTAEGGSAAQTEAQKAGEGTVITYVTLGDTGMELLKEAAAEFKNETGIEVKLESWAYSDAYQKILTLAEGGNMPDAMYGFSSWTQQFKEAGYTVAIDSLISKELYDDFSPAALDVCKVGGELWAMPSYMSIRGMLFNKNRMADAGIEKLPTTWEEFLADGEKLTDPASGKYAYAMVAGHPKNTLDCFLPILWAYDADVMNADGTANGFNNENGVAALQMYVDLAKYAVPDYGQADINSTQNNFTTQIAAAYFHNAQGLAALKEAGEDYSWAEITEPLAGPNGSRYSLGVMDVDLVFNTGNQEAAAKWLEFWHTAKYQGQVINQAGFVPNQQSYFKEIPEFTDPSNVMVAPFAAMEPMAKFKPSIICWEEVQKAMADAVTKAVMGEISASEAMELAGKQVDELLAKQ
ncbi:MULTISPECIES: ABC transporter substrate-binding protein [Enterocloster]|uniref:Carbohydrate ABC transporter substrate-binding protein, CUT1 family n=2 Tax=Enterocloster lavalensis TaxID=460384 RepID=A0A1I0KHG6_9FIRM|nr:MULTISPECIES: sugar ABC transporter substrate-binding protein [Enterocloster]MBS5603671.1 sugar ABC transporter substrate-binding protein [Enterocloster asparagiformis]MCB6342954.1 sugar ABC transporter substrate-binding protein [Enterocloster lavalensis]MDR3759693.1 sugar ABC transporter substrate-binding protein [Enterocloster sp.]SEU23145.1 carbohydrate ABC transporter substrate-binding protein, CUT1 family [Enterocloster lavalensis]